MDEMKKMDEMKSRPHDRPLHWFWTIVPQACLFMFIFLMVHTQLWMGSGYLGWDAVRESWGDMLYGVLALQEGTFPFWNPLERGGYPFFADPQTAVLYPPTWLIYFGVFCFGGGLWVPLARTLIHILIGAFGLRVLARSWSYSPWMSSMGGLCFILSGRIAKAKDSAGLWTMVWIPWVIWATDRCVRYPVMRQGLILSMITTLCFYAGYPPNLFRAYLVALFFGGYLLFKEWKKRPREERSTYLRSVLRVFSLAIILTLVLCSPGIIATIDVLSFTVRTKLTLGEILQSRLYPVEFLDWILPRIFHPKGYGMLYMGLGPALCGLYALSRPQPVDRVWFIIALFSFFLACGHHSPLLPFLVKYVSVFGLWRVSEQYLFISIFALLMISLRGAHLLITLQESPSKGLRRCMIGVGVCTLGLLIWRSYTSGWSRPTQNSLSTLCVLVMFVYLWRARSTISPLIFYGLLTLITSLDLAVQHRQIYQILQPAPNLSRDLHLKPTPLPVGERMADDKYFRWRAAARLATPNLLGRYSTMVSARYKRYSTQALREPALLSLASVSRYAGRSARGVYKKQRRKERKKQRKKQRRKERKKQHQSKEAHSYGHLTRRGRVYELNPAPYAYWTPHIQVASSPEKVLRLLSTSLKKPPNSTYSRSKKLKNSPLSSSATSPPPITLPAIFERPDSSHSSQNQKHSQSVQTQAHLSHHLSYVRREGSSLTHLPAKIIHRGWGEVKLSITSPQDGALVLNEAWDPNWLLHIQRGGQLKIRQEPTSRVNYLFQGVYLKSGEYTLTFIYHPTRVITALWSSLIALCILIFGLFFSKRFSAKDHSKVKEEHLVL